MRFFEPFLKRKQAIIPSQSNIDKFPLPLLKFILDQLDLPSIFRLKKVNKILNEKISEILDKKITISATNQASTYFTLRRHPELRPEFYFGELYYKSKEFEKLRLAVTDAFIDHNVIPNEHISKDTFALILFNIKFYFENAYVDGEKWESFKGHLEFLIGHVFFPLPLLLNNKKLFFFVMEIFDKEVSLLGKSKTDDSIPFTFFISLQKFLKLFVHFNFFGHVSTPQKIHNFIKINSPDSYELLSYLVVGLQDFLTTEFFEFLMSFLEENKLKLAVLRGKCLNIFEYLLPLSLCYFHVEKKLPSIKEADKLFRELLHEKNIANTVTLSDGLEIIGQSGVFSFRKDKRVQSYHLFHLVIEFFNNLVKEHKKRFSIAFVGLAQGLSLFSSAQIAIKLDHVKLLFDFAKNYPGALKLAEAIKIVLENNEQFVTIAEISNWIQALPKKMSESYLRSFRLSNLIYGLTKSLHALGKMQALQNKEKIIQQLIRHENKRIDKLPISESYPQNFLKQLGLFYDTNITINQMGIYLLNAIDNDDCYAISLLYPELILSSANLMTKNLIVDAAIYEKFITVITIPPLKPEVTLKCLKIIEDSKTVVTTGFLDDFEDIRINYEEDMPTVLTALIYYRWFKPQTTFEEVRELIGFFIIPKSARFAKVWQEVVEFYEKTGKILSEKNKDYLFRFITEKLRNEANEYNFEQFSLLLKDLIPLKDNKAILNLLLTILVELNLHSKTDLTELLQFNIRCLSLYNKELITVEELSSLIILACANFNLANTFSLTLMENKENQETFSSICQRINMKAAEAEIANIPAVIHEALNQWQEFAAVNTSKTLSRSY